MNDKLIVQLIDFYKSRGIDLHYLLDDNYFVSLPLADKIKAVKEHAQEILEGTSPTISKLDIKKLSRSAVEGALVGAFTGGVTGMAATRLFSHGKFNPMVMIPAASIGVLYGGITGAWNERQNLYKRRVMHNELKKVVNNPTDETALHTLMTRNLQNKGTLGRSSILDRAAGDATNEYLKKIETMAKDQTIRYNESVGHVRK